MYEQAHVGSDLLDKETLSCENAKSLLTSRALFQAQTKNEKERQLKGKDHMHRQAQVIAVDAGIDGMFWASTYIFLSQFAHTSPMAVYEFANGAAHRPIAASHMRLLVRFSNGLFSKIMLDLASLVPDAEALLLPRDWKMLQEVSGQLDRSRFADLREPQ